MLKIRPFEWKDVDSLNQIINDPEVAKYTQEVTPLPLENMVHQFSDRIRNKDVVLVAEESGNVAGHLVIGIGKDKLSHVGSIGIFVKKELWGREIGTKLLEEGIKAAKQRGLKKLIYDVYEPNERSINLAKQFGFELDGRLKKHMLAGGIYLDKLIFEKLL
jgi:RimJ/RimL family protein N-acetyltransferase